MFLTQKRNHNRGRLWLEETPALAFPPTACLEQVHEGSPSALETRVFYQTLAVEAFYAYSAVPIYGALCARFDPDPETTRLTIRVNISDEEGLVYEDAFNIAEYSFIVLPEYYAPWVLRGALEAVKQSSPGGGTITYCGAAHGPAHSSARGFYYLGGFLASMLTDARPPEEVLYEALSLDFMRSKFPWPSMPLKLE